MYLWFVDDPQRMLHERDTIASLQGRSDWLIGVAWGLDGAKLYCDATIRVHSYNYEVRLVYPALFPDTPPSVKPRDEQARWSLHQYGVGGTLCLEWGPDNWHSAVTGAQLLVSAFHLLYEENPLGSELMPRQEVPSRHSLTLGQELRFLVSRSFASNDFLRHASDLASTAYAEVEVSSHKLSDRWTYYLLSLHLPGEDKPWLDSTLPEGLRLRENFISRGLILRVPCSSERLKVTTTRELVELLRAIGLEGWPHTKQPGFDLPNTLFHLFLVDEASGLHHYLLFEHEGEPFLILPGRVPDDRETTRQSLGFEGLAALTVAIIGAGSLGSKVAVSLARAGVRHLLLVDHDVMLPGNVIRHALDWEAVGFQKVEALAEEVRRIAPGMAVEVENVHLTGQESNSAVAGILEKVAKCALIVDATADSQVFNLLGSLAHRAAVPLVWGFVYAGGLGGLIARSRPKIDPAPLTMRAAYLHYCKEHELEADDLIEGHTYDTEGVDGQPMVASDADVGVIAHHIVRVVLDILTNPQESAFPTSMYLVGLREGWIFEKPFQNVEVSMNEVKEIEERTAPYNTLPEDTKRAFLSFVEELISQTQGDRDEAATSD